MDNVDTNSELTVEKITETALPEDAALMRSIQDGEVPSNIADYKPLIDFFGVSNIDRKTQEQLQNVWEYYSRNTKNPADVLKNIKMQLHNLAQPQMGDTRLNQLNNYVRILQQLNDAKEMKEAYEQ